MSEDSREAESIEVSVPESEVSSNHIVSVKELLKVSADHEESEEPKFSTSEDSEVSELPDPEVSELAIQPQDPS